MTHRRFARGQTVEDHHVYITREEDLLFHERALDSIWFSVRGCRTMGKTSLIVRNLNRLEKDDCQVAMVDIGGWSQTSADDWMEEFAGQLLADFTGRTAVNLEPRLAVQDLSEFLTQLCEGARHTLVVIDEVDWLSELEYGHHILARLRAAQTKIARAAPGRGLSLCFITLDSLTAIAGAKVAPIISTLQLNDFPSSGPERCEVVEGLAEGFLEPISVSRKIAEEILDATGGQPFQTMILASEMLDRNVHTPEEAKHAITAYLEEQRDNPKELFAQINDMFLQEPLPAQEALNAYEEVLQGHPDASPLGTVGADFLLRSGLVRARNGRLEPKGRVFKDFFNVPWIERTRDRAFDEQRRRKGRWHPWSHRRPRLCILNTGGTVGMVRRGGKVVPPRDESEFLRNYSELEEMAEIDFEQPFVRDSINVYPQQWTQIAESIYRKRSHGYTGFVVAHGTDTMAFSASAVAFALGQNLGFPVVFTGAQTTPEVLHGDSHANLLRACVVASKGNELPEVVICFGSRVFRAVRAQKKDERRFEGFDSLSFPALGEITEDILLDRDRIRNRPFLRADLIRHPADREADIDLEADFSSGVLLIQLTPGLEPSFYLPSLDLVDPATDRPRCKGVIVQTLGAGNVANLEPYSFTSFLRKTVRRKIPVLITSPYPWSSDLAKGFGPAAEPLQLGAIIGGEITAATAVTKFRWAIAKTEREILEGRLKAEDGTEHIRLIMTRNYLGEKDGNFYKP